VKSVILIALAAVTLATAAPIQWALPQNWRVATTGEQVCTIGAWGGTLGSFALIPIAEKNPRTAKWLNPVVSTLMVSAVTSMFGLLSGMAGRVK
jgi:hypothetical protein